MTSKRAWNALIVIATMLLAALPVLANQFHREVARWYLAAAATVIDQDDALSEQYLKKAAEWVEDVTDLRDYWLVRVEQALHRPRGDVSQVVAQAIKRNKSNFTLGLFYASDQAMQRRDFAEAVEILEVSCIDGLREQPYWLNQLAYFRSLAVLELDIALEDINRALEAKPDDGSLRDTRAWVLFQMGRPLEALADADFAVDTLSRLQSSDVPWYDVLKRLELSLTSHPEPRSPDKVLTLKEAGQQLWGQGALHYHRAKILEALGRTEQAEADFQWLRERRLPTDDRLF